MMAGFKRQIGALTWVLLLLSTSANAMLFECIGQMLQQGLEFQATMLRAAATGAQSMARSPGTVQAAAHGLLHINEIQQAEPHPEMQAGFTTHFLNYLNSIAPDLDFGPGFGGATSTEEATQRMRIPVVFVHGHTDRARGGSLRGWQQSYTYFRQRGYAREDLYGLTWGQGNPLKFGLEDNFHSEDFVRKVRRFLLAVLHYTQSPKVHLIAHSMGVTLSRAAIQGGRLPGGTNTWDHYHYDLGPSLSDYVDTFIGCAGANYGIPQADMVPLSPLFTPTNLITGFHPESEFLRALRGRVGRRVYSIYSTHDPIFAGMGETGRLPQQDGQHVFNRASHVEVRDAAEIQFRMISGTW